MKIDPQKLVNRSCGSFAVSGLSIAQTAKVEVFDLGLSYAQTENIQGRTPQRKSHIKRKGPPH